MSTRTQPGAVSYFTTDDAFLSTPGGPAAFVGASVFRLNDGVVAYVAPVGEATVAPTEVVAHLPGTLFGGFSDSHVHLGLIDPAGLAPGGVARVVDLGWMPDLKTDYGIDVAFAGAFLTAPGGYPSRQSWAPEGACLEIRTADESARALARLAAAGASVIKLTLNSVAGPVFDDALLEAIIRQAHALGVPVVAHAEGEGQAWRAAQAGVDYFAHTPFTERLTDDQLASIATTAAFISTLDIHGYGTPTPGFEIALDNLARFAALGGRVVYGTDLGNGPLPVGLNERELGALAAAGLGQQALVSALTARIGNPGGSSGHRLSYIEGPVNHDPSATASWLSGATVLNIAHIEEIFA
ncbi:amidohydrolase family protein [Subtercola frigoramans]|uniref:Amidohydrolase n=1 Tax=Subtercola frigoramans TaxID=120298 RepID=A0ABS2L8I2_9MICO|nr:amidohydrolase [Subtercola frigoramans]MBM7473030.1 hypothetical protein [Subtercola frigoramans]